VLATSALVLSLVVSGASVDSASWQDSTSWQDSASWQVGEHPAPGASATATPRPVSSRALRTVETVELRAESVVLRDDDGDRVTTLSMRDAGPTVRVLDRLLGTPSRTRTAVGDAGRCTPAATTSTWGGALRVSALAVPARAGNAVEVRLLRPVVRSRTGTTLQLTGPDGVRVGDDVQDLLDDAAPSARESLGSDDSAAWQLLLARGWRSDRSTDGQNGVSALTVDTDVVVIGSPMPVRAATSC
jgi:hypothetical protein